MRIRDRLYGPIELPPLAHELAESCPVLLRLREVRMANIPFASYPSFSNVSRYEHSVGVAHLAWRFALAQDLPEDEAQALTIAALYHDGASPAFGHLYEELLLPRGFDHEEALVELLTGKSQLPGRAQAQIFLGRRCRLPSKLPPFDEGSVLSCAGIAAILGGGHRLSPVIVGSLDLDNIDNVIRAATAMGVVDGAVHPYDIVDGLAIEDGELRRLPESTPAIAGWQAVRRQLYSAILGNAFEFRAQAAIKWAIVHAAIDEPELVRPSNWTLTEPELVFEHLRLHPPSRELVDGVRLGSPPPLIFSADVEDVSPLLSPGVDRMKAVCEEIGARVRKQVFLNFYVDKGDRSIELPLAERSRRLMGPEADSAPTTTSHRLSGVVGIVSGSGDDTYSRDRHGPAAPAPDDLGALLASHLGLKPTAVSSTWTRRAAPDQLPIFA